MANKAAAHAKPHHQHPNYMAIFWVLLALTILEVGAAVGLSSGGFKIAMLVGMAVAKAALVAAYFMHLRFEKSTLVMIAFTPMVLCVFLLFMLFPDSAWLGR